MFKCQCCVSLRLSAHRKRSCLFPSPASSLVLNISPELDGQKTADSKCFLEKVEINTTPFHFKSNVKIYRAPEAPKPRTENRDSVHCLDHTHHLLSLRVSAWAVMMDRRQQCLQLVLLPPALFIPAHQEEASKQESLEALGDTVQPFIIYQETSDIWINVRPNMSVCCSPTL